jgi:cyclopropane fatty-acyl-phospholipid synthase-like methyltransferase
MYLPGEGEGRNAVYAARNGWTVDALDQSRNARNKALELAELRGVTIRYELGDLMNEEEAGRSYDAIGLIFIHMVPEKREKFYSRMIRILKPGGYIIVEGFNKAQINNTSGGPQDVSMLFSRKDLEELFHGMEILELYEYSQILEEGRLHTGKADTIRLLARKKD